MRKRNVFVFIMLLMSVLLYGCGTGNETSESKTKTETETITVNEGMIPQVIEKSVTLVQKEKGGEWEEESSKITNWGWSEDFYITDTVWIIESDDAYSLYSNLNEYYKGKPASLYIHFGGDLKDINSSFGEDEDGTPKLDISLSMTCDAVFECGDEKLYIEDAKVTGGKCYMDGTSKLFVDFGEGEGIINVPADVKKGAWKDFYHAIPSDEDAMKAESDTFISKIIFEDTPSFNVTSENIKDGVWDDKITNTKYGDNSSPQLSWDSVDGASEYVVIMIDGAWLHMDVFTSETSLSEGQIDRGERGNEYVGPYPPSGTHTYSVFVFALKEEMGKVMLSFDAGGNSIDLIYQGLNVDKNGNDGNVLAYGRLDGNYTHKD